MRRRSSTILAITTLALIDASTTSCNGCKRHNIRGALSRTTSHSFKSINTATSSPLTLAGLGQGTGSATLTVTGFCNVICSYPGKNSDVPGQQTSATGTSRAFEFTAQNGKASISSLTATLNPSNADTSHSCPNSQCTPLIVGSGIVTSATLTVTFNGQIIFQTSA